MGDAIFFILLVFMAIFLIPFYGPIIDIWILSAQFLVGTNTYLGLLGFIFGLFIMFLAFRNDNGTAKVFSLILSFAFLLSPFWSYFGDKVYLERVFDDYHFKDIYVIQPTECEFVKKTQEQFVNKLEEQYGGDLDLDIELNQQLPKNIAFKDKIKCMPAKTHYVYVVQYTDSYGQKRLVSFDDRDQLNSNLKSQSFEVLYSYIQDYFEEKIPNKKTLFEFYIYEKSDGLLKLDRTNIVSKKLVIPLPTEINLSNFNEDKRFVLDVTLTLATPIEKAHEIIEELDQKTDYPLQAIVRYGNLAHYYRDGQWTTNGVQFLNQLEKTLS